MPKLDINHTCLAVISLNSALRKDDSYYPKVFLKECKYIAKKFGISIIIRMTFIFLMSLLKKRFRAIRSMIFENVFFEGEIL